MMTDTYTPPLNKGVHIYRLLLAGWAPRKIAQQVNCSTSLVWKFAKIYERENRIERTCKYPAMWRAKKEDIHPHMPSPTYTPIFIPHRLGASFRLIGNLGLRRDRSGFATIKDPAYTVRYGRSKAVIWLKSFTGATVEEQISNGRRGILALSKRFQQELGITLTFDRWFEGIDWVMESKKGSKVVGDGANLKEEPKVIAGAELAFDDSHKENLEVRPAVSYPPIRSTDVAKILEYLITRAPLTIADIDKRVQLQETNSENIKLYNENIQKHMAVLQEMSETLKAIRTELKR